MRHFGKLQWQSTNKNILYCYELTDSTVDDDILRSRNVISRSFDRVMFKAVDRVVVTLVVRDRHNVKLVSFNQARNAASS